MNLSLLSRSWITPCATGSITFLVLQAIVIFDHLYSCNSSFNSLSFTEWTWISNIIESILFSILVASQVLHVMFKNKTSSDLGSIYTTICIGSLGGISSFLSLLTDWTGVSGDVFGVKLPGSIWAEWLVCVPIIYYTVLATDDIQKLSLQAKLVVLLITCVFITGFCMQFTESYIFSVFLLIFSFVCFFSASLLFYYITIYADGQSRPQCESFQINEYSHCLRKIKRKLSICILCITPLFPMVYLMSLLRIINQDTTYVLFISLNIVSKFLFVSTANNSYISVDAEYAKIKLSTELSALHCATIGNQTRKLFLRYIMHEVRVPLNSISMGLGYLEETSTIDEDAQEALLMMSSASEYMKQALDEVLNLQTMEEGFMKLNFAPINIHSVIRKARASVVSILKEKEILLDIRIDSAVSKWVIGDASRIEIVITNILNNALKFSDIQSIVEIGITSDNLEKNIKGRYNNIRNNSTFDSTGKPILVQTSKLTSTITFTIIDHGPGISPEDLPSIFVPFSQIHPHELHCRGSSGIGLLMCKQIVELHGGSISCQSTVGVGSTFTITIPFKLCDDFQYEQSEYKSSYNTRLHRNKNKNKNKPKSSNSVTAFNNNQHDDDDDDDKIDDDVVPRAPERTNSHSILITDKNLQLQRYMNLTSNKIYSNKNTNSERNNITTINNTKLIDIENLDDDDENDNNTNHRDIRNSQQVDLFLPLPHNLLSSKSTSSNRLCNMIKNDKIRPQNSHDNFSLTLSNNMSKSIDSDLLTSSIASAANVDSDGDLHSDEIPAVVTDYNDHKLLHVLVTDDVSSSRKLLAMLLGKRGITSTMAANGREAVELIQHTLESYDIIFMDNAMPIMNGVDATRAIRAVGYPNLIIGVTGNAMVDDVAEFIAAGADSVILKPLSVHQLQQIMDYISVYGKGHTANRKIVFDTDHWEYSDAMRNC